MRATECPHCNRMPEFGSDEHGSWVECPDCQLSTGYCSDLQAAIEQWNAEADLLRDEPSA